MVIGPEQLKGILIGQVLNLKELYRHPANFL